MTAHVNMPHDGGLQLIRLRTQLAAAGTVVNAADTAVGSVTEEADAQELVLYVDYTKGAEDGLQIGIKFPLMDANGSPSSDQYSEVGYSGITPSVLLATVPLVQRMTATGKYKLVFSLRGARSWQVYQQTAGGAGPDGTFSVYQESYRSI